MQARRADAQAAARLGLSRLVPAGLVGVLMAKMQIFGDESEVARQAASFLAERIRAVAEQQGNCLFAVSGGRTPWLMLRALATESIAWNALHVFQVDERIAPAGDADRNWTHLRASLTAPIPESNWHPMPVESPDLDAAARDYETLLNRFGRPLDLVHLGLGPDGHTASLVPGDPVLDVTDRAVAPTGVYQGRRRLTLTYPTLNASGAIVWLVAGPGKGPMLTRLLARDPSIPAGRVASQQAVIFADQAAAADVR